MMYDNFKLKNNQSIGILAASAIGSELTQSTLNTFHSAGVGNDLVTKGVARIQECANNSSTLNKIIFRIKPTKLDHIVYTKFEQLIIERPVETCLESCEWIQLWENNFGAVVLPNKPFILISIKIPLSRQLKYDYDIESIKKLNWCNEDNMPIPIACSPLLVKDQYCFNELIVAYIYDSDFINDISQNFLAQEYPLDVKLLYFIERIYIPKLLNMVLFGIQNVERIIPDDDGGSIIVCNSFASILNFIHLDPVNIICNKTSDMLDIFGIEVARKCLISELINIMPNLLKCNIIVIIDKMTWSGKIDSISRYSARRDPDVLKKISFEEAVRNIIIACVNGEIDYLISTSSKIVASKRISRD